MKKKNMLKEEKGEKSLGGKDEPGQLSRKQNKKTKEIRKNGSKVKRVLRMKEKNKSEERKCGVEDKGLERKS